MIAQLGHVAEAMGAQQHRLAGAPQLADQVAHGLLPRRVEALHRLVQHQQRWVTDQSDGQPQPLQHAFRARPDALGSDLIKPDLAQLGIDRAVQHCAAQSVEIRAQPQEFVDATARREGDAFRQVADATRRASIQLDRAGVRKDQSQQELDEGGFARPVGAEEAEDRARRHSQIQVVKSESSRRSAC